MNRRHIYRIFLVMTFFLVTSILYGQMANYKSLYLYNFIKRIEWPNQMESDDFHIIIMGDDATAVAVQQIASTKMVGDRKIQVQKVREPDDIESADLIYVAYSKRKYIDELVAWIANEPILLVSDYKNAELTDINLMETNDGLEFIIRPDRIRAKELKLSDMLILLGTQEE